MPLTAGTRLGSYEVVAKLGEGGMGEVYRARDTRLDRFVAIKVLPVAFASDSDRRARFEREAKLLASLNHPLIAQVYGLEQFGDACAIVMELVDGPTLDDRIRRGPIAIAVALPIARQIAEALETAHDLGIIHRDLKPANVKLKLREDTDLEGCTVKVLDFGLAKTVGPAAELDPLNSPTVTARGTELGMILGTAAYMAPEQARGRMVDRRADVWAFGVVLYEMLTGTRLFKGEDASDTLAAVLRQPIELSSLPSGTPGVVRALLERCLERDPRQRLRDIGEARIALDRAIADPAAGEAAIRTSAAGPSQSRARTVVPWALFGVAMIAVALLLSWGIRPSRVADAGAVTRVVSDIGVPGSLVVDTGPAARLSPDGRSIVLRVRSGNTTKLYMRRLDELTPIELAGTEQAIGPFFSPDGTQIGFFAGGGLKTMPLSGGAIATVADAATGRGAVWAPNGDFIFQSSIMEGAPLVRVTATGARTDRGTTLAPGEASHRWPQLLPDGRLLYSAHTQVANWDTGVLRVETEPGVPGKVVVQGGYHGTYVPTGHLLYIHAGTLYAVRFDVSRLATTSEGVPIVERVAASPPSGGAEYSVASNGTLAYVPGNPQTTDGRMYWLSADGKTSVLTAPPGAWSGPRFSPDGKRIAMAVAYGRHEQIAVYDLASDRLTAITSDASNHRSPAWSLDGTDIIYSGDAGGALNIFRVRADGSGQPARLTTSPNDQMVGSIHPDGLVGYSERRTDGQSSLWMLPLNGPPGAAPRPIVEGWGAYFRPEFSPDGRLVAYPAGGPGGIQVFVRRVDGQSTAVQVSDPAGVHPVWSRKANELLYVDGDHIMAVPFSFDGTVFKAERPRPWSAVRYQTAGPTKKYDLDPSGTRAVISAPDTAGAMTYDKIVFVFNFFDELRRKLP